jgi:hypothetical protein
MEFLMSPFPMSKVSFKFSGQDEWEYFYLSKKAAMITKGKRGG